MMRTALACLAVLAVAASLADARALPRRSLLTDSPSSSPSSSPDENSTIASSPVENSTIASSPVENSTIASSPVENSTIASSPVENSTIASPVPCPSETSGAIRLTDEEVLALFANWNAALATLDPKKVAALYAPNAVLLPTVSNEVRNTPAKIEDYFVSFLKYKPQGAIDAHNIVWLANEVVSLTGVYTFTLDGGRKVQARFSYVFKSIDGKWLIEEHHSSAMPEGGNQEIEEAFKTWNEALQTLDADKVVDLYAPGAVLLPTLSDTPRNSREEIKAYFVDFLKKKPFGVFEYVAGSSPNIKLLSPGVASLSGTAAFTLTGTDDTKSVVRVRKTFVFVKYGNQWLISEHHSSQMPGIQ